jgi:kynurenine formamidase
MKQFVDLSHPLTAETPPFPGDPAVEIRVLDATDQADDQPRQHMNCSRLSMCVHCGTHMDAPFHFFGNGATIDRIDADVFVGEALMVSFGELPAKYAIDVADLTADAERIAGHPRLVFNTGWYRRWRQGEEYFTDHPVITRAAAELLVAWGVRLLAVDFPSVDRPPHPAHLALLGHGVVIVENLTNLHHVTADRFHLIAVPLPLVGRDGSPVRALAQL